MTLATPFALAMLLGLALMFFALQGFDRKHALLGGRLANLGTGGIPVKPGGATGSTGTPVNPAG